MECFNIKISKRFVYLRDHIIKEIEPEVVNMVADSFLQQEQFTEDRESNLYK